jgi:integrase/recombinase XerD
VTRRPLIANWPNRDRELWEKGVEPIDLFETGGAGAGWSAASRFKTASGYSFWLQWLAAKELLDIDASPADRVTRERVASYVGELSAKLAPYSVLCRVQELHDALRVITPESSWDWLARVYRTLRGQVHPLRDKLSRLKPIDELAALGKRLMDEAEAAPDWSARRRAVLYRDGLMIALLAYRPIRLKNLAMMRLGPHLTKAGASWQIHFAADETKSHVPYEANIPSAIARRLERYLDAHRPFLMRGERADGADAPPPTHPELDAVWVSEVGTQLEMGALARRVFDHTRSEFGRPISPHLFRDCAATSIAVHNPKHVGDASLVLGHAGHAMTEKHYNHARSLEASRRQAQTLTRLRCSLSRERNG